ncbi:MAG: sulfur carrier protein ThiS [Candidatus Hodarchaeaceae archaeon]|nr:sulfur carrier protein ThiS [Candidatus Hodarchaeaceae archaeon]
MRLGEITVKVRVIGQRATRKVRVAQKTRAADLLNQLGLNRETVVVRLNGKIVAEEERLADGDSVEILPVVTGG